MSNTMAKAKLRVRELAEAAGFAKPHALQLAMGISPSKASRLWKADMDSIALDTLYDLCIFFKCSPADIIARTDNKPWPKKKAAK